MRLGEYSRGLVEVRGGLGLDHRTRKPQVQLQTIVWGKLGKTLSILAILGSHCNGQGSRMKR